MLPTPLSLLLCLVGILNFARALPELQSSPDNGNSYDESLLLRPLADGKLSVLFGFHTKAHNAKVHHSLTPPTLILPLQRNNVSELHLSFAAGRWQHDRWGAPLHPEVGGTGAEMRAWIRGAEIEDKWTSVTNAMAGIFCSSLGQIDSAITTSPVDIFPRNPRNSEAAGQLLHAQLPSETLCTENLTPFLKLLPCKGISGISGLMKPYVLLAHDWHAMGVDYRSNEDDSETDLVLWWEAVVNLVDWEKDAKRDFSIQSLFDRDLPRKCPVARTSDIILTGQDEDLSQLVSGSPSTASGDGFRIWEYGHSLAGKNLDFRWINESTFIPPVHIAPNPITFSRILTGTGQLEGGLETTIRNNGKETRRVRYVELLPWWIQPWMHELRIDEDGRPADHLMREQRYIPAIDRTRPTTLSLELSMPPGTALRVHLPFNKAFIRYTEHPPDASRGFDLPPAILYLRDLAERDDSHSDSMPFWRVPKLRIYSSKLLLDLATPDFSMPYNVIIMTSTLMALFFGSVFNAITRRFGVIEVETAEKKVAVVPSHQD